MRARSKWAMTLVVMMSVLMAAAVGCSDRKEQKLTPTVKPPLIKKAGTLRAGVDLTTPPFAGAVDGKKAGLDIDVAAALAKQLGLELKLVDVKPSQAASALAQGDVDVVMSLSMLTASPRVALAGTYVDDAPVFFISAPASASVDASLSLDTLTADRVGVQERSLASWSLRSHIASESIVPFETLRDALVALDRGDIPLVAGDAIVGGYIIRDLPGVAFAGQLEDATPLSVGVAASATELSDAVRHALDDLAADGALDSIRRKWLGSFPELRTAVSAESTVAQ